MGTTEIMKWEHKTVITYTVIEAQAALEAWGEEGWEMVSAIQIHDRLVIFFKRPKPS